MHYVIGIDVDVFKMYVITLLEGKPPSLLPEALRNSTVGAVCLIKIAAELNGTFMLLKRTNQLLKILRS